MKKTILVLILVVLMLFNTAYAETNTNSIKNAGIKPDNWFHSFDKLIERVQLAFTNDIEKEAELLVKFLEERLSEAESMSQKKKSHLVKKTMKDYLKKLKKLQDKTSEIMLDDKVTEEFKEMLRERLETALTVKEKIKNNLDEEAKKELKEKTDEAYLVANVVEDIVNESEENKEKVISLREEGLGYGQIAQVFLITNYLESKKDDENIKNNEELKYDFDTISNLFIEKKGYGYILNKELSINPSELKGKVISNREEKLEEALEKANKENKSKKVDAIKRKLERVKGRK